MDHVGLSSKLESYFKSKSLAYEKHAHGNGQEICFEMCFDMSNKGIPGILISITLDSKEDLPFVMADGFLRGGRQKPPSVFVNYLAHVNHMHERDGIPCQFYLQENNNLVAIHGHLGKTAVYVMEPEAIMHRAYELLHWVGEYALDLHQAYNDRS